MNNLDNFLLDLNDTEFAIFIAYRFDYFLDSSRKKIITEVQRRKLSRYKLSELFRVGLASPFNSDCGCPQCNSTRYYVEIDYELKQTDYCGYETAIETNRCRLCGFNPAKNKQKGFINRIKKFLGFYRRKRLKRPEIDGQMFT